MYHHHKKLHGFVKPTHQRDMSKVCTCFFWTWNVLLFYNFCHHHRHDSWHNFCSLLIFLSLQFLLSLLLFCFIPVFVYFLVPMCTISCFAESQQMKVNWAIKHSIFFIHTFIIKQKRVSLNKKSPSAFPFTVPTYFVVFLQI